MTRRVCTCVFLAGLAHLMLLSQPVQAQSISPLRVRVRFMPVIKDHMGGVTWTAMTKECERIWRTEGIEIAWDVKPPGAPVSDVSVPLVFDDRELAKHDRSKHQEAFGITVFAGRAQRVLVSVERVRDLLSVRRNLADSDDSTVRELATGVLLGRVVAHELGHVLLLSTSHSRDGLMSPKLTGPSLGPFDRAHFALSSTDRDRIARRFSTSGDGERRADASMAVRGAP